MIADQTDGRDYSIHDRAREIADWMTERSAQIGAGMITISLVLHANQMFKPSVANAEGPKPNCYSALPVLDSIDPQLSLPDASMKILGRRIQTGNPVSVFAINRKNGNSEPLSIHETGRIPNTLDEEYVLVGGPKKPGRFDIYINSCGGPSNTSMVTIVTNIYTVNLPLASKHQ